MLRFFLTLFLFAFLAGFPKVDPVLALRGGDEGGISSSGGEFFSTEFNPWFLRPISDANASLNRGPVHYCIEINSSQFSITNHETVGELVQNALDDWTSVVALLDPEPIRGFPRSNIETRFSAQENCNDETRLQFSFGVDPTHPQFQKNSRGLPFTPSYSWIDQKSYQHGEFEVPGEVGFVADRGEPLKAISGKRGLPQNDGFWSEPRLRLALLHQVGHIFGFQRVPFGIMEENVPVRVVNGELDQVSSFKFSPFRYVRANWFYSTSPIYSRTCGSMTRSAETDHFLGQIGVFETDIGKIRTVCLQHSRTESAFVHSLGEIQLSFWGTASDPIHEIHYTPFRANGEREAIVSGIYSQTSFSLFPYSYRFRDILRNPSWREHTFIGINRHLRVQGQFEHQNGNQVPLWIEDFRGNGSFFEIEIFLNGSYLQLRAEISPSDSATERLEEQVSKDTGNEPWFVGEAPVNYCIRHDPNSFSLSMKKMKENIRTVIKSWVETLEYFRDHSHNSAEWEETKSEWIATDFRYQKDCTDETELVIQLGGEDSKVKAHFGDRSNQVIGVSYQKGASRNKKGRVPGVIYLSRDLGTEDERFMGFTGHDHGFGKGSGTRNPLQGTFPSTLPSTLKKSKPGFWSESPHRSLFVLAHEFGHLFGLGHLNGIMSESLPKDAMEIWNLQFSRVLPTPSDYLSESILQFQSHFCMRFQRYWSSSSGETFELDQNLRSSDATSRVCFDWDQSVASSSALGHQGTLKIDFYLPDDSGIEKSFEFKVIEFERSTYVVSSKDRSGQIPFFKLDQGYHLKLLYNKNGRAFPASLEIKPVHLGFIMGHYGKELRLNVYLQGQFHRFMAKGARTIDSPIKDPIDDALYQ